MLYTFKNREVFLKVFFLIFQIMFGNLWSILDFNKTPWIVKSRKVKPSMIVIIHKNLRINISKKKAWYYDFKAAGVFGKSFRLFILVLQINKKQRKIKFIPHGVERLTVAKLRNFCIKALCLISYQLPIRYSSCP